MAERLGQEGVAAALAAMCKEAPSLAAGRAIEAAQAQGLQLLTSTMNETGFFCVMKTASGKFRACIVEAGKPVSLGTYKTAEEAALKVAERLGQEGVAAALAASQAQSSGEPLGATQRPLTQGEVISMHSQRVNAYSPAAIRASIAMYDCHMTQRPPTFDDEHINPDARLADLGSLVCLPPRSGL